STRGTPPVLGRLPSPPVTAVRHLEMSTGTQPAGRAFNPGTLKLKLKPQKLKLNEPPAPGVPVPPKLPKIDFIMSPTKGMLDTPVAASTLAAHLLTSSGMQADTSSLGRVPMAAGLRMPVTVPSTEATQADTFAGRPTVPIT